MTGVRAWLQRAPLRTRILAGVLAVTLTALAAFGFVTVTVLHSYMLARTDSDLQTVLSEFGPMLHKGDTTSGSAHQANKEKSATGPARGPSHVFHTPRPFRLPAALDNYYVELTTGQGPAQEFLHGNEGLVPRLPTDLTALAAGNRGQTVTSRNGHAQLRLLAETANGNTLIVTTSLQSLNSTVSQLSVITALGMLAVAVLVFTGVSMVIRRGLRPVQAMAAVADRITAGDLTSRVSPHDPATEVGRLGTALNGMLGRIHAAVREREASEQAARQFFADASHELRTPLAALRAIAELYQQGALPRRGQVDEAMDRIAVAARRMGNLVDDMLRLARLDQGSQQHQKRVDLSALAADCADRARPASPEHTWHACVTPGITIDGDAEMLRRAIDNLLANVTIHTPPGTTATLTVTANSDGAATIEVSDDGPGVPAAQIPRIFDRFYRAPGQGHRPGSGLGLAIAAATATAHHGTATAAPNHPHGLRVALTLPGPATWQHDDDGSDPCSPRPG